MNHYRNNQGFGTSSISVSFSKVFERGGYWLVSLHTEYLDPLYGPRQAYCPQYRATVDDFGRLVPVTELR